MCKIYWKSSILIKSFVRERLIEGTLSHYNTIKKNSLALYPQKDSVVISTSKQKIVDLCSDSRIYFEFIHSLSSKRR